MALRKIKAFQNDFDVEVERNGKDKLSVIVVKGGSEKKYTIREGATQRIDLSKK